MSLRGVTSSIKCQFNTEDVVIREPCFCGLYVSNVLGSVG